MAFNPLCALSRKKTETQHHRQRQDTTTAGTDKTERTRRSPPERTGTITHTYIPKTRQNKNLNKAQKKSRCHAVTPRTQRSATHRNATQRETRDNGVDTTPARTFMPTTSTSLDSLSSSSAVQVPLPFTMWFGLSPTLQWSMQAVAVFPGILSAIRDHLGPGTNLKKARKFEEGRIRGEGLEKEVRVGSARRGRFGSNTNGGGGRRASYVCKHVLQRDGPCASTQKYFFAGYRWHT